ncbi:DNA-binding protein [Nannocystis pusilla]|uniref:DNA-binding protein n=1 Tax=Nannocystis pusilla TaxID=889268 RepID=UPI003DA50EA3
MPHARPFRSLLVGLCLVSGLTACREPEATDASIAAAREQEDGAEVTVRGHVSVAPGTFESATFERGFAVADDGAGIYVKMDEAASVALGDEVEVTGVLGQMAKMRVVTAGPSAVAPLGKNAAVSPASIATGEVDEDVEGRLVRVTAAVTKTFVDDAPYGYKLWVDDGSGEIQLFFHVSAGFDAAALMALTAGQTLAVTGLAFQYEDTYEVAPRSPADLVIQ